MATFQFYSENCKNDNPVKVEVYVGGVSKGFTSGSKNDRLMVKMNSTGNFDWYAKKDGKKIASGRSDGGNIFIPYDPS